MPNPMPDRAVHFPESWPLPADALAAGRLHERFAALGRAEARLAARPEITALLHGLGGNSPFLADLAVREASALRALLKHGPDAVVAPALAALRGCRPTAPRAHVAAILRLAKRRIALATALADIGGLWSLEQVTGALSDLAEAALQLAMAHLLRAAHDAGEITLPHPADPARDCGFTVLGMGKLGARELNYSSDIDLVLLYDPDCGVYSARHGADAMGICTSRLARGLVALMEARDADGYVFRTDLRLRPDPSATPPAVALPAALTYYESMGQNWERAAMIKARPVAGDLAMGAAFLAEIRPFIWRRGLDFASVAEIHAMKQRINSHKGGAQGNLADPAARIAGHNVKLGAGGIREIEFLAQTLQLVWGGRDPGLRVPTTLGALQLLIRAGHLPAAAVRELEAAYRFLRRVEHRLQMVADRQTHDIPERPADLHRVALFLGYADANGFALALLDHLHRVRAHYADVFEAVPALPEGEAAMAAQLDFSGDDLPAATMAALARMGFANQRGIGEAVRGWQAGHVRALRSERARGLIRKMLPAVLAALGRQPRPDLVFGRFDALLARLPAGVPLLSLFEYQPALLDRVAAVLGAAPMLADHLARNPAALDGLMLPAAAAAPSKLLRARLADARTLEDVIEITRRSVREAEFAISVATMEGELGIDAAGLRRTAMADAALRALLPHVLVDFVSRNGRVRGGAMAVVALGKAGGREMMAGSDLDLMLIYDHPAEVTESTTRKNGAARRLPVSQWFVRAAHAYVAAVTAPGVDGPLYAVDMRLRPSGNKGPVAVSLAAFQRYHATEAWMWERMALTRARIIAGPPALRAKIQAAIQDSLTRAGDPAKIRADAAAMRARLARDLPPDGPWDVKLRPGGLMEVEFVAQVLQLIHAPVTYAPVTYAPVIHAPVIHAPARPDICSPTTRIALARLAAAGMLAREDADALIRAERIWRTVQGMLRITLGRDIGDELPEASAEKLLRACAAAGLDVGLDAGASIPQLRAALDGMAATMRTIFTRQIGEITG